MSLARGMLLITPTYYFLCGFMVLYTAATSLLVIRSERSELRDLEALLAAELVISLLALTLVEVPEAFLVDPPLLFITTLKECCRVALSTFSPCRVLL